MSDVSEHDSDSDTDTKETGKPNLKKTTKDGGSDNLISVVNELKQQAATVQESEDQPEWEKYMKQNKETGSYTYTDPTDGTIYEWDAEKRGWIPKIDDDFIALYQANYGFTSDGKHDPNVNAPSSTETEDDAKKMEEEKMKNTNEGKKRKAAEEWFEPDPKTNNNVYVSGLPTATTEEEFIQLMSKYGIIMCEDNGKEKIKMYRTAEGQFKGDARCCYLKHESVVLSVELLDESDYNGSKLHVEQAVFQLKGKYNPKLKPKKPKKKKKTKGQEKLLDWVDRPQKRSKFDKIVILKNMFDYKEFEKDPSLINDLKGDLRSECEKFGEVKKVLIFDRNPEGVASILFLEPESADDCVKALNGRFYGGRTLSAQTYDGVTNYKVQETEEQLEKRLSEWEKFIAAEDDEDENKS